MHSGIVAGSAEFMHCQILLLGSRLEHLWGNSCAVNVILILNNKKVLEKIVIREVRLHITNAGILLDKIP